MLQSNNTQIDKQILFTLITKDSDRLFSLYMFMMVVGLTNEIIFSKVRYIQIPKIYGAYYKAILWRSGRITTIGTHPISDLDLITIHTSNELSKGESS